MSVTLFSGVETPPTAAGPRRWVPLSVLTVGSAVRRAGIDATVVDAQVTPDWRDAIATAARRGTIFGVTCLTGESVHAAMSAVAIARRSAPGVPVVWGGYHASLFHAEILREGLADVVVVGNGERAMAELAVRASGGVEGHELAEQARDVPGAAVLGRRRVIRSDGAVVAEVVANPARSVDINSLPPVDYELVDVPSYFTPTESRVQFVTSYGCHHGCTYCAEPAVSSRRWSGLRPDRIISETRALWRAYGPEAVDFMDANFSSKIGRVLDFVDQAPAGSDGIVYMCNMRARDVVVLSRQVDLRRLRSAGIAQVFIGVESGSDAVLRRLKKGSTVDDTVEACRRLADAGILTYTSFMHDLPEETTEESEASLSLAEVLAGLGGNQQSHHFYMPFPGTEMFDTYFTGLVPFDRPQAQWAESSTFGGSPLWTGRPEFRARVRERLEQLRDRYPDRFLVAPLPTV